MKKKRTGVGRRRGRKEKGRKRVDVYRQLRKREGRVRRRHSRRDPQGRSRSKRRVQAGDHNLFFVFFVRFRSNRLAKPREHQECIGRWPLE